MWPGVFVSENLGCQKTSWQSHWAHTVWSKCASQQHKSPGQMNALTINGCHHLTVDGFKFDLSTVFMSWKLLSIKLSYLTNCFQLEKCFCSGRSTHPCTHAHRIFFLLFIFLCTCGYDSVRACRGGYFEMFDVLGGHFKYSTVSVIFPLASLLPSCFSSFLSVLALGPTVILRVYSCLDLGPETGRLQHV